MPRDRAGALVAIDSNVLVWGIKKQGSPKQLHSARCLFERFEEEKTQIVLPSVALAEFLTAIPVADHQDAAVAISARFFVAPFDVRCASLAATLFAEGKSMRQMGVPGARACLRADSLIIATSYVHGARLFYSGDHDCRELATNVRGLEALDLPDIPATLWGYRGDAPVAISSQLAE